MLKTWNPCGSPVTGHFCSQRDVVIRKHTASGRYSNYLFLLYTFSGLFAQIVNAGAGTKILVCLALQPVLSCCLIPITSTFGWSLHTAGCDLHSSFTGAIIAHQASRIDLRNALKGSKCGHLQKIRSEKVPTERKCKTTSSGRMRLAVTRNPCHMKESRMTSCTGDECFPSHPHGERNVPQTHSRPHQHCHHIQSRDQSPSYPVRVAMDNRINYVSGHQIMLK